MNKKFIFFYFLLIVFLSFNFNFINSISPPVDEYNCADAFITKFNFTTYFKKNATGFYDLCASNYCYLNGSIKGFYAIATLETGITSGAQVVLKDLECLPNVNELYLASLPISDEFLYNKLPYVTVIQLVYVTINPIYQTLPSYSIFYLISNNMDGVTVKLSYFNNINTITIDQKLVNLERDIDAKTDKLKSIRFLTNTLPNLDGYVFDLINLYFGSTLNIADLDNFQYIKASEVIFNFAFDLTLPPYFLSNTYISTLSHSGKFQQATQIYDISVDYNYSSILLQSVSKNFFYLNQVPLKLNNNQNLNFYADSTSDTTVNTIIPSPSSIGYLKTLQVASSSLTGDFISFNGSGYAYDFSNNKITGTIDPSWCGTNLIVINNQLTGTIPSCFTCHFNSSISPRSQYIPDSPFFLFRSYYSSFSGNLFTNYDRSLPCTTMAPKIRYYNDTTFIISGTDIGFDPYNFYINSSTPCNSNSDAIINYGYEYYCNVGKSLKGVNFLSIKFRYVDYPNDRVQYFSLISHPPVFTSINISTNSILLEGSYFSSYIGHSKQIITVDGLNCTIDSSAFLKASCIFNNGDLSLPISKTESSLLTMTNANETKKVYIKTTDGFINNKVCPNDCINNSTHGNICDMSNGECRGIECEDPTCGNGNGQCQYTSGQCLCKNEWSGVNCLVTIHYISSVIPSYESGGIVSFIGFFSYVHDDLKITIGDKECTPTYISTSIINCTAQAGKGIMNVNMTQNGITFIGNSIYRYKVLQSGENGNYCTNNCSNNGVCSSGQCKCNQGYGSYDCSLSIQDSNENSNLPQTTTEVDEETGSVIISNEKTNFKIYARSLYEVDIMGNTIKSYKLNSDMLVDKSSSSPVYTFIQNYKEGFIVNSTIETITSTDGKEFKFADIDFKLEKDSTKFTISISNYTYQSFLNTLKLEFVSVVNDTYQDNEDDNDCNKKDTNLDSNNQYDFNFIKIEKNNKIMIGRFINMALSDSRPTYLSSNTTKEGDSVIYTISLPHFVDQIVVDPDFSMLISADFSSCSSPNENNKWKIPIATIVPVCFACAIAFIVFKYRKKSFIKVNGKKLKLNELK